MLMWIFNQLINNATNGGCYFPIEIRFRRSTDTNNKIGEYMVRLGVKRYIFGGGVVKPRMDIDIP